MILKRYTVCLCRASEAQVRSVSDRQTEPPFPIFLTIPAHDQVDRITDSGSHCLVFKSHCQLQVEVSGKVQEQIFFSSSSIVAIDHIRVIPVTGKWERVNSAEPKKTHLKCFFIPTRKE